MSKSSTRAQPCTAASREARKASEATARVCMVGARRGELRRRRPPNGRRANCKSNTLLPVKRFVLCKVSIFSGLVGGV